MGFRMALRSHGVSNLVLKRACPPTPKSMPSAPYSIPSLQAGSAHSCASLLGLPDITIIEG